MRPGVSVYVIAALLIAICALGAAAQAREDLEYLAGAWRGTFEASGEGTVVHEIKYTWDPQHKYLKITDRQMKASGETITLDGFLGIDRAEGKLHAHTVNSEGQITWVKELSREGKSIVFEGSGVGQPWLKMMRERIEFLSEDSFLWQMLMPNGDDWNAVVSVTYERIEAAGGKR